MPRFVAMIGEKFDKLTVLAQIGLDKNYCKRYVCVCDCGGFVSALGISLRTRKYNDCGCLKIESDQRKYHIASGKRQTRKGKDSASVRNSFRTNGPYTHGLSHIAEYTIWGNMLSRCRNASLPDFKYYGGRGISVSDDWLDFENFLRDMGYRPSPIHQLDRIDNNGNYRKGNVRWVLPIQNARNKSNTHWVFFKGRMLGLTQASVESGIPLWTLKKRLKKEPNASEERLFRPVRKPHDRKGDTW